MNQDSSSPVTGATPPSAPLPMPSLQPRPPSRRAAWGAVAASFAALGVVWLVGGLMSAEPPPLHFMIDGSPVLDGVGLQELSTAQRLLFAVVAVAALLAAVVIVPLALLWVAGLLLLGMLGLVGPPMLALAAMLALLLSPLWLIGWLLWRVWRKPRRRAGSVQHPAP
jgi:hypothetical protein